MTVEQILENFKKYCTKLESADMLQPKDYSVLNDLERFTKDGIVTDDQIISAFKKANESDFLCGKKTTFKADIKWMCNPVNLEKINNGKYDDKPISKSQKKRARIQSHEYDWDEIERKLHQANDKKLEKIRNDKDHQRWLDDYFYKKYPNMKGAN